MTSWSFGGVGVDLGGRTVLDGVELSVEEGRKVLILGPSGCGKTTLARAGLGLVPYQRGAVHLLGHDTRGLSSRAWRDVRRGAQLLFQDPLATLHPDLPVEDSLLESARLHPGPGSAAHRVALALRGVGLTDIGFRLPRSLSGGERRRASLARVSLAAPRLLVADEPTAGLDEPLQAAIARLIVASAPTVVIVTHDAAPFLPLVDDVVVLDGGRVLEHFPRAGTPATALGRALLEPT